MCRRWFTSGTCIGSETLLSKEQRIIAVMGVLEALICLHQQNITHGDLKASNVLLDKEGNALLSDFVAAQHIGDDATQMLATPIWMAPELMRKRGVATFRTDLYQFGLLLFCDHREDGVR
jgi:serine/threonine protein kinase